VTWWQWLLIAAGVTVAIYAAFAIWLLGAGRRQDARALAGFIPDCLVVFRRLLADERVPRRRKLLLIGLIAYLAMPFDLVPDFIPVASQTRRRDHRRVRPSHRRSRRWPRAVARALARTGNIAQRGAALRLRTRRTIPNVIVYVYTFLRRCWA
jgi:hypothetical protein